MNNFKVENKQAFRIIGFKTVLTGGTSIHSPGFSSQKTTFFKSVMENGQMATLRPLAESSYGFAAVARKNETVYYYPGVQSSQTLPANAEEVLFRRAHI